MIDKQNDKSLDAVNHPNGYSKINKLEHFFELSLDMLCIIGVDGYFKQINLAFERTLGWLDQELMVKPFVEFVHSDDIGKVENAIQQLGRSLETFQFECRFVCRDGSYKWLIWKVESTQDEVGYAIGRDVTTAKQKEAALEGSEDRFRRFVSSLGDHIYVTEFTVNGEQINQYLSPNVESLTGYSVEKLMSDWQFWGQSIIHSDDRDKAALQVERFLQGEDSEVEYRLIHANGRSIWVRDSGRVEVDSQTGSLITYGVVSDITSRKAAEDQLKQREERTSLLNKITSQVAKDPSQQLEEALALTLELLDVEIGIISQVEDNLYTIRHFYAPNAELEKGQTFELGNTYCSITLQAGGIISIDHMQVSAYRQHPCYGFFKLEAYIGIPIIVHGQIYGTLNFSSLKPKTFSSADRDFIKLLSSWVSAVIERSLAGDTLRESEARLSQAQQMAKLGTWVWDIRKNTVTWSEQLYEIFNIPRSTVVSNDLYQDLIHPEDREQVRRALENSLKSDRVAYEFEHRLMRPDGEMRYIAGISRIQRGDDNQPIRMIGVAQDVTERKFAEETIKKQNVELTLREDKLRQNIEKLQATQVEMARVYAELKQQSDQVSLVQQIARIGAWEVDVTSHTMKWNDMMFKILRMPKHKRSPELYELTEMVHPDDRELYLKNLHLLMRQGIRLDQELKLQRNDEVIYAYIVGLAQYDANKKVTKIFGLFQDITRRKQVEETLRESETRLSEAQYMAKLGTWSWDVVSNKVSWSDQLCEIFGLEPGIRTDFDTYQRLVHPDDQEYVLQNIDQVLKSGGRSYTIEHRIIRKDGQERFISSMGRIDLTKDGQPVRLTGVAQDITKQKRSEIILAKQAKELETVAKIATTISTISDPDLMLQTVVNLTKDSFDLDQAQIYLLNETHDQLIPAAVAGDSDRQIVAEGKTISLDEPYFLVAQVARERRGLTVSAADDDDAIFGSKIQLPDICSELAVPIMTGDQLLGVLTVQSTKTDRFLDDDMHTEMTLASQVAVALQNARYFEKSEAALQKLNALTRRLTQEGWQEFFNRQEKSELGYHYDLDQVSPIQANDSLTKQEISFEYPLVTQGEIIGQLELIDPQLLSDDAFEVIEAVAERLSTHLENLRLSEQSQRALMEQQQARLLLNERVKELNCLTDIGRKIIEVPPIFELLTWIAERIPPAMQYPELCVVAIKYTDKVYGCAEAVEIPSQIVNALRVNNQVVGKIYIAYTEKQDFLDEESTLLGGISTRISSYLESRYLFEQTQAALARTETLYVIGQIIGQSGDTEALLQKVSEAMIEHLDYASSWVALVNEDAQRLEGVAGAGEGVTEDIIRQQVPLDQQAQNPAVQAVLKAEAMIINDVMNDERTSDLNEFTRSILGRMIQVPIIILGNVVAIIALNRPITTSVLTKQDLNLIEAIAEQLSIGLQNIKNIEKTQDALAEANVFRQLVEASGQGIGMVTLDGEITYINSTLARILGEPEQQTAQGKHFLEYYTEDYRQMITETVLPAVLEQEQWTGETWLRSMNGQEIPAIENYFLIRDEESNPIYIADVITNITERNQVEKILRDSQEQLSQALQIAKLSYWELDLSTQTLLVNDQLYNILGTNVEIEGGYTLSTTEYVQRFVHPDDAQYVTKELEKFANIDDSSHTGEIEYRFIKRNGEEGVVLVNFWIEKTNRNITKSIGTFQDITERKQTEEVLRSTVQENSQLVAAINNASIGITISDATKPDNPLIFVNPAFTGITGYTAEDVLHKNCRFLQGPDTDPETVAKIRQAVAEERSIIVEIENYRKDGTPFWNELRINPIFDEYGDLTHFIGIQTDISSRKATEAEREKLLVEVEAAYRQYVRGEWEKFLGDQAQSRLHVEYHQVATQATEASQEMLIKTQNQVAQQGKLETLSGSGQNEEGSDPAIVAPISLRGETIGTLSLQDIDPDRHWTSEEIALVETISEQLALTIENLRLFDDTQRRATREQLTRKITDKMRAAPNIETIIETGLAELADVLQVPRTYVKLIADTPSTKEPANNSGDKTNSK